MRLSKTGYYADFVIYAVLVATAAARPTTVNSVRNLRRSRFFAMTSTKAIEIRQGGLVAN